MRAQTAAAAPSATPPAGARAARKRDWRANKAENAEASAASVTCCWRGCSLRSNRSVPAKEVHFIRHSRRRHGEMRLLE